MARKLKTYTTSAGFFDLAIAAPSMKAALEAWGSKSNLFHHGFARQTDDPKIVAATMARPGIVLRRPVGSQGTYSEHADLPRNLPMAPRAKASKVTKAEPEVGPRTAKSPAIDDKAARRAARAYEKEQKRRDSERRKEEAAREKERRRREQAIAAAQAALAEADREHDTRIARIQKQRAALDARAEAEESRWRKQKEALETALRKARSVSYLRTV